MQTFKYIIKDDIGIHARPAGALAKISKKFKSKIMIESNNKTAEAIKPIAVMGLGVKKNSEIIVTVEGEDEMTAVTHIKDFLKENL